MAINRLEITNPEYGQANTRLLTIHSSHIKRRQDVSVYYDGEAQQDVPIIILLHGVYGSNWVWMELGGVHKVYQQLKNQGLGDFILVMPSDGGIWDGSAYLPLKNEGNFEQWIMDDVLTAVKQNIPQASETSNLYITGLSMGGYGALRLGAKFSQQFSGISAHSSVTNMEDLQQFIEAPITQYKTELDQETHILYWMEKNRETLPPIRFDCGEQDSLFESNLRLKAEFEKAGIKHHFEAFSGGHEWPYWTKHIESTLWFFNDIESAFSKKMN